MINRPLVNAKNPRLQKVVSGNYTRDFVDRDSVTARRDGKIGGFIMVDRFAKKEFNLEDGVKDLRKALWLDSPHRDLDPIFSLINDDQDRMGYLNSEEKLDNLRVVVYVLAGLVRDLLKER